jgi:ATP-binding cassette, subfamily C (CFTR/MRP), member 1
MSTCHQSEGWRVTSKQRIFDLTPCFEEGIVLTLFYAVLIAASVIRALVLCVKPKKKRSNKSRWVLRSKIVCFFICASGLLEDSWSDQFLLFAAMVISLANVITIAAQHKQVAVLQSYILEPISLLSAIPLTYFNHYRTRTSSTILLIYWPLYTLAIIVWARTIGITDFQHHKTILALKCVSAGLGLATCALENISPEIRPIAKKSEKPDTDENPMISANFFSVLVCRLRLWPISYQKEAFYKTFYADFFLLEPSFVIRSEELHHRRCHTTAITWWWFRQSRRDTQESYGEAVRLILLRLQLAEAWHFSSSFGRALIIAYGGNYGISILCRLVADLFTFAQPQLLRLLLNYISAYQIAAARASESMWLWPSASEELSQLAATTKPPVIIGFTFVALMFLSSCATSMFQNQVCNSLFLDVSAPSLMDIQCFQLANEVG